mmetsp:Transcript_1522/g.3150  ORF Transcript_1522/g.3150 Transcript_1522/m.3150 type:complete len:225 (-) Transcript_1522:1737-2411(-)|eukprot:CAMPEP_0113372406 /NCGR_PEP_ID=MMETSP0013_2-20120614/522_1 /TAXON_ID=2843 ORGANISM="Skeletonema costatum, Strain 1716" /NCGR_SAMPLE_ID=MMETSP0013_2 /ASSEMBLY_ACC=CAM_ASM_000158 /LENGTH=224 /DNA_ID=CAMNT_0000254305 /DNA_START=57 /DNA_END=731 /DNA_ORIENTATION=+ /assembly_acc=CAM_ASM_000158
MSSASPQPNAFVDSDEDNASMETSDLKNGDVDSLDKSHDLPTEDDDTENDDDEVEDDEAIPVASIVASNSLSDDDAADDEKEGKKEDAAGAAAQASSAKSEDNNKTMKAGENPSTPPAAASGGKRKAPSTSESSSAKKRQPAAKGLFVPFRTVKKIMQQDPDINIIQNDAAIMVTAATKLFLTEFTEKSLESCKRKGRNTIKYDDVAEVRAKNKNYAFLDMLLP